ncbi:hypothetical protein OROMI_006761 [Orobanche minor]
MARREHFYTLLDEKRILTAIEEVGLNWKQMPKLEYLGLPKWMSHEGLLVTASSAEEMFGLICKSNIPIWLVLTKVVLFQPGPDEKFINEPEIPVGAVVGEVPGGEKGTGENSINTLFAMVKLLVEKHEEVVKKVDAIAQGNKAPSHKLDHLLLKVGGTETTLKIK